MNTRRKGNRIRLLAIKKLESQNYWVNIVEKAYYWARQKDLFGLFDLIALRRHLDKIDIKFIQIKSNRKPPLTEYIKFKDSYGEKIDIEIWVYKDRIGFTRYQL